MAFKKPKFLVWLDAETTGLSFRDDDMLELGAIITTMELQELSTFERVVQITPGGVQRLKENEYVLKMHQTSGLLDDIRAGKGLPLAQVEEEFTSWLGNGSVQPGEYLMAGSGILHFDRRLLEEKMPTVDEWFAYYALDMGVNRRVLDILLERNDAVPKLEKSYKEGAKAHRALADARAHLDEARLIKQWLSDTLESAWKYDDLQK